jgi:hypothetical protein
MARELIYWTLGGRKTLGSGAECNALAT